MARIASLTAVKTCHLLLLSALEMPLFLPNGDILTPNELHALKHSWKKPINQIIYCLFQGKTCLLLPFRKQTASFVKIDADVRYDPVLIALYC